MQLATTAKSSARFSRTAARQSVRPQPVSRKLVAPHASWDLIAQLADAAPGEVNAPIGVAVGA